MAVKAKLIASDSGSEAGGGPKHPIIDTENAVGSYNTDVSCMLEQIVRMAQIGHVVLQRRRKLPEHRFHHFSKRCWSQLCYRRCPSPYVMPADCRYRPCDWEHPCSAYSVLCLQAVTRGHVSSSDPVLCFTYKP